MRFLSFGAGAIGAYIGGSLALAGHDVFFLERPEPAEILRERGLSLTMERTTRRVLQPRVVTDLDTVLTAGPFDAALLAVKAYDTAALMETLQPYRVALPPVICFQNGVENEALVTTALGEDKIIPASVTTAIGRHGPGEIVVERLRGVGLANEHILANSLVGVFSAAGLHPRLYANGAAMKWSKLLTNLLANASSAILNMAPAEIYAHPALFRMEMRMLREALQVMSALHIPIVDLPGTPVRALAFAAEHLPTHISQPLLKRSLGAGRGEKMPSFHIDLQQNRRQSEVDYLNGAVVRFGQRCGVPAPVNQLLTQTLLALVHGEIPRERFAHQPEALLAIMPLP
jgi:2-dehydropantoate 2-reductase